MKEFKQQVKVGLLRKALNTPDKNGHTPLHIASYFGDFKSQKFMVDLGAVSNPKNCEQRPLEIGKDKFARGVL
jgi:ankyrin repeat protein